MMNVKTSTGQDFKSAGDLVVKIKTWVQGPLPKELVSESSVKIVTKSKINAQNRTRRRTGELLSAHDRALHSIAFSEKKYAATIIIDSINVRGESYAGAVESGGWNPLTMSNNRPRWFFRDAVNEFVNNEMLGVVNFIVNKIPKK